ncbi:hypothetical protein J4Q44_G00199350 [Coregonus suidteri]|uniref:Uncharacterized protein n=1 Tax=Coregonus suidteri TaxID=861788 RepID=A0AAN8QMJ6_9TELE
MNSSGSQSWSWGLKAIPCNWRFLQNDCPQLPCRALHGWVHCRECNQGHLGLPHGGIQACVKATCVLHNFMRMDTRTCSSPPCARGEVCSAGCCTDGGQQRSMGGNPCAGDLHLLLL